MKRSTLSLLSVAAATFAVPSAHAALFWDPAQTAATSGASGGAGTWDVGTTANWASQSAPGGVDAVWSPANIAEFGGTAGAVTVASGISAQQLVFDTSGYVLSGGDITLTAATTDAFVVKSGVAATINTNLSKSTSGEAWVRGGGTLVLGGTNAFNRSLVVAEGSTLEFSSAAQIAGTGGLYIAAGGGTVRYTGSTNYDLGASKPATGNFLLGSGNNILDIAGSGVFTISGGQSVNGGGAFIKTGAGTLVLSGNNTFTSGITVRQGVLQLGGASGSVAAANTLTLGNATGNTGGKFVLGDAANAKNTTVSNLISAGTGPNAVVAGGNAGTGVLTVNSAVAGTFSGVIGGSGTNENNLALVKSGAGVFKLSGANTFAGGVTVSGGTLVSGNAGALGAGNVTLAGGTLQVGDGVANTLNLASAKNIVTTAATASVLKFFSAGSLLVLNSGAYDFSQGTLSLDVAAFASAGTYNLITNGSGNVDAASYAFLNGTSGLTYAFANGTLHVAAVPEPGAYGLLGATALAGVALVRRRRTVPRDV